MNTQEALDKLATALEKLEQFYSIDGEVEMMEQIASEHREFLLQCWEAWELLGDVK